MSSMTEKTKKDKFERGPDRRRNFVDPKDLPFPDRRQRDRRVYSDEEREEIINRIIPDSEEE
jgi:hypothetical protein